MPIVAKELTHLQIKSLLSKPGYHNVGGCPGLQLAVGSTPASASWLLRILIRGKRREVGLGGLRTVSLAQARAKGKEIHEEVSRGEDPIEKKRDAKRALRIIKKRRTLAEYGREVYHGRLKSMGNDKHKDDWINSLENHIFPILGDYPIDTLTKHDFQRALTPTWSKRETSRRMVQRLELIMNKAKADNLYTGDNPAQWKGNLQLLMEDLGPAQIKHHAALPWQDMPLFWQDLQKEEGEGRQALMFVILNWTRDNEVRGMLWSEIDFGRRLWIIPGARMKKSRIHELPLSNQAIALLEERRKHADGPLVFNGIKKGKKLSSGTLLKICERMVGKEAVTHGMRSSAMDWSRSEAKYPEEVAELQLAHVKGDKTKKAYARDKLVPQRRQLVQDWADYLDGTYISIAKIDEGLTPEARLEAHATRAIRRAPLVISHVDLLAFIKRYSKKPSSLTQVLTLQILTWAHIKEVLAMEWTQLDLESRVWTIPENIAKNGFDVKVPLSDAAMRILKTKTPQEAGLVFPHSRADNVSETAIRTLCDDHRGDDIAFHALIPRSLRHSAAKWALDRRVYGTRVVELQLGHVQAEMPSEKMDERRVMLEDWAQIVVRK
jgi:integrase